MVSLSCSRLHDEHLHRRLLRLHRNPAENLDELAPSHLAPEAKDWASYLLKLAHFKRGA